MGSEMCIRDSPGYGLNYITFTNGQGVKQTLGVSSGGFQVFDGQVGANLVPKNAFAWKDIAEVKGADDTVVVSLGRAV